jgi:hypothetical protein
VDHLDAYIAALREQCARLPDTRTGANVTYSMVDFGLAAFSVFHMQCPSFLHHQQVMAQRLGRSNAHTLFGMTEIPCDNQTRVRLDGAPTDHFDEIFSFILKDVDKSGGLAPMRRLDGRILIALDGSEHFCSRKIHCPQCSTRKRSDGGTEYFHTFLGAVLVAPGCRTALPLPPEFVRPQDGAEKQDCESNATRRWLKRVGPSYASMYPVYLGDDLHSRQPTCQEVLDASGSFIFVCKQTSHKILYEYVNGGELGGSFSVTKGAGDNKRTYRYRWMCNVPLRDGDDALKVNWFEMTIVKANGKTTNTHSFVTDLPVSRSNIEELVDCGRARWKIENENFNVLKNNGYNLEHNFGHGKETLASILVVLNLLAFLMHGACELTEHNWQVAREKAGSRSRFFNLVRDITVVLLFPSWRSLMRTIAGARPPPQPP